MVAARVKTTVMVVDDHNLFREGLISLIEREKDLTVVGEAESAEDGISRFQELGPDVVVMDIRMQGMSGIDACQALKEMDPAVKVIVLSMYDNYQYVDRALQVGADGYLLKKVVSGELVDAIRKVAGGESVFSPQVMQTIVRSHREGPIAKRQLFPLLSLTNRESEVLKLASDGLRSKEIASRLCISVKTVDKSLTDIYRKLGVTSRVQAIRLFLKASDSD